MNYEDMSDFEINKAVAFALGMKVQVTFERHHGFTEEYHKRYPSTIWAAECDKYGKQIDAWEQKVFTKSPEDAWPIILGYGICITSPTVGRKKKIWSASWNEDGGRWSSGDIKHGDENPLRAAMIVFLMMKDAEK